MESADDVPTTTMAHDSESDCKCSDLRSANEELTQKIANLEYQLNEAKSEIAVAQFVKESVFELEREKTGLGEEMATLQQLLNESHDEASSTRAQYEQDFARIQTLVKRLEQENQDLRIQMKLAEKDGIPIDKETLLGGAAVISDVTKSLTRRLKSNLQTVIPAGSTAAGASAEAMEDASLEEGMRKAYEDTELLKSIVVPLEEQIGALKDKLREADGLLREYEVRLGKQIVESLHSAFDGRSIDTAIKAIKEDISDENKTNLLINLLIGRQAFLSNDLESVQKDYAEVQKSLDNERKVSSLVKVQAAKANENLLRHQQRSLTDLEHLQSVLTDEQKAKLAERMETADNESDNVEKINETDVQIVSADEWNNMQNSVKKLRKEFGFEDGAEQTVASEKYRQLEQNVEEYMKKLEELQKSEEKLKNDLLKEADFRREVEEKWTEKSELHRMETEALVSQVRQAEELLEKLRTSYSTMYEATRKDLQSLTIDREKIVRELRRLQDENDNLIGKHSAKAAEMQNEMINLPDQTEDMHLLLLKYREDLIAAKIAKERLEEKLRSEVSFIKAELTSEQQAKETIEDQLTSEIDALKERISVLESYKTEFEAEKKRRQEFEGSEQRQKRTNAELQSQMERSSSEKKRLEQSIHELRLRVSNLQQELDNSVAVQTDFVRLSQSLQIELEKIRQSEKEVRWQHEEDIDDCQNCKVGFSVARRKHHCRHCGRIFCSDCVSKSVRSGPHGRSARVCDVCHTLLVQNTAPYFSRDAPHPD